MTMPLLKIIKDSIDCIDYFNIMKVAFIAMIHNIENPPQRRRKIKNRVNPDIITIEPLFERGEVSINNIKDIETDLATRKSTPKIWLNGPINCHIRYSSSPRKTWPARIMTINDKLWLVEPIKGSQNAAIYKIDVENIEDIKNISLNPRIAGTRICHTRKGWAEFQNILNNQ